jgi:hypothetical protein
MHFTRRLLVVPALAVALGAAACGSSADDDFVDRYNAATAPLNRLTTDLAAAPAGGGTQAAERKLVRMADGLEDVKTRLDALEPPSDARQEYDRMLRALDGNAAQTREMAEAVAAQDLKRLADESQAFAEVSAELVDAESALRAAVSG